MSVPAKGRIAFTGPSTEPVLVRQVDETEWVQIGTAGAARCEAPPNEGAALRRYLEGIFEDLPHARYLVLVSDHIAGVLDRPGYLTTVASRPVFALPPSALRAGELPFSYPIATSSRSALLYRFGPTPGLRYVGERDVSYDVLQSRGPIFDPADPTLADALEGRPVFIVVDRRVDAAYGAAMRAYAAQFLDCVGTFRFDALESAKSLHNVEQICKAAYDAGLPRNGVLVGVGGGVTLDQAGLAAALYRRGVRFARVPTTLVAIVDVAVGIKQGVNAHGGKNILGTFYPAYTCINDITFLASLSHAAIASGIAEIIKMAIICDPLLFVMLELDGATMLASSFQQPATATDVIVRAQIAMMDQLQDNLYEENHARFVDLGHTFSPALEKRSGYRLPHGDAVGIDMVLSSAIALELGLCDRILFERLVALLRSVGLPVSHPTLDRELAIAALAGTRTHRGGNLNLVVPRDIGAVTFLSEVDPRTIDAALAEIARLS
jgi:3-dehydroquinate synthetase